MPGDLRKGIVRILDSDGNTADTGFLVTADGKRVASEGEAVQQQITK